MSVVIKGVQTVIKGINTRIGPDITDTGLALYLDAYNPESYPGTGTTWYDLSPNGNNGTLINGPTFDPSLKSIILDGVNDYVNIPDSPSLDITNALTLSAWVFVNGYPSNYPGIIAKGYGSTGAYSIHVRTQGDYQLWFDIANNPTRQSFNPVGLGFLNLDALFPRTGPKVSTRWHNVVSVFNGTTLYIYLDGVLVDSVASTISTLGATADPVYIGRLPGFGYLQANVSVIMIHNIALNETQIIQNYNAIKGRYGLQ